MNEYISRIEKGEYELVVRCDDYRQFKVFENMIRVEMARISSEKSWQRIAMDDFSKLTAINESDCKNCISRNGIFKAACDSCKRKGAETSKACNELHKQTEEEITSLKCELAARAKETEALKGKLLHLEDLLKEKDRIISELIEASEKVKKSIGKLNKNDVFIGLIVLLVGVQNLQEDRS